MIAEPAICNRQMRFTVPGANALFGKDLILFAALNGIRTRRSSSQDCGIGRVSSPDVTDFRRLAKRLPGSVVASANRLE